MCVGAFLEILSVVHSPLWFGPLSVKRFGRTRRALMCCTASGGSFVLKFLAALGCERPLDTWKCAVVGDHWVRGGVEL